MLPTITFYFLIRILRTQREFKNCYKIVNLLCIGLGKKESVVMSELHQVPLEKTIMKHKFVRSISSYYQVKCGKIVIR